MTTFSAEIYWTQKDGTVTKVKVSGRESSEQAAKDVLWDALMFGWTPPRWWQWWRKNDTTLKDITGNLMNIPLPK